MKNIIDEKPTDRLFGHTRFSTLFINSKDIKNKTLLDIGCGYGWFEIFAEKKGVKKIIGVERNDDDLKAAKNYIKNSKIDFKVGDATRLPFKDNSFDTIVAWEVIEHIPGGKEDQMFKEVNRVLKRDGVFYLSTPYGSFFSKFFDPTWWLIRHRHYSKRKLIEFGKNNNFSIEEILIKGGWWEVIGMNNLYIAKWIFRRRPIFEKFIQSKQDLEYKKGKGFTNIFIKFRKI
jgi:ubiquinone/menaquinone biosynthesis C-methylase UbiE